MEGREERLSVALLEARVLRPGYHIEGISASRGGKPVMKGEDSSMKAAHSSHSSLPLLFKLQVGSHKEQGRQALGHSVLLASELRLPEDSILYANHHQATMDPINQVLRSRRDPLSPAT